ncbi:hypothetical protein F5X99DRAFT_410077 [Biscogniauxia marginata]|nr:hypothetical protein F5X99DRAFT_410077 [Biscogniauxia marginata]
MSLLSTPNEILTHILSFFIPTFPCRKFTHIDPPRGNSARQRTLSRTSRTCWRLRCVTLPVLYHTIPATSHKLLKTLAADTYLASLVKAIDLSLCGVNMSILRGAYRTAVNHRSLSLPPNLDNRLRNEINVGIDFFRDGITAALYLALLPNIEEISYIMTGPSSETEFIEFFSQADRMLPRLREFYLNYRENVNADKIHISSIHDLLPTLKTLHVINLSWELNSHENGPSWSKSSLLPPQLGLKHVNLEASTINHAGLSDLLSRSPGLQTLRIEWTHRRRILDVGGWFKNMGDALRKHGQGLEELVLNPAKDPTYRYKLREWITEGPIGSLRELNRLKSLTVPYDSLVSGDRPRQGNLTQWQRLLEQYRRGRLRLTDILPESLERLCIMVFQDDEELDLQMWDLVRERERFPNLQRIQMYRKRGLPIYEFVHGPVDDLVRPDHRIVQEDGFCEIVLTKEGSTVLSHNV